MYGVLEEVLYEFPVQEISVRLPRWVDELEEEFWLRDKLENSIRTILGDVRKVRDVDDAIERMLEIEVVGYVNMEELNLGTGTAAIEVTIPRKCSTM